MTLRQGKRILVSILLFAIVPLAAFSAAASPVGFLIEDIELIGHGDVPESEILGVMETETGDTVGEQQVRRDMERIYDLGYFLDIEASTEPYGEGVRLIFNFYPNPKLREIEITGNRIIDTDKLLSLLGLELDTTLNTTHLREGIEKIRDHYDEEGYVLANVVNIDIDPIPGLLEIEINEGRIADIEILVNEKTREHVITRELTMSPGDVFNLEVARRDRNQIFNLGYFDDVALNVRHSEASPNDVIVMMEVEERKTGNIHLGAGYSSQDGWIGFFEVQEKNLLGRGQEVDFSYKFGEKTSYELSFFEPWLDRHRTSFGVDLYSTTTRQDELLENQLVKYNERRRGGMISLGRPTGADNRTYIRGKYEGTDINFLRDYDEDLRDIRGEVTRSIILSNITDTRDNVFDPREGKRDQVDIEYAGQHLGGDFDFTKYELDMRRYFPALWDDHTLAVRLKGGTSTTFDEEGLPRQEKYRIGGAMTLRGYADHQFRGDKFLLLNSEYRVRVIDNVDAILFCDVGNTWEHDQIINLEDHYRSLGLGVQLNTPIGQIRLDYGFALDQEEDRDGRRLHFSLGSIF